MLRSFYTYLAIILGSSIFALQNSLLHVVGSRAEVVGTFYATEPSMAKKAS